MTRRTIWSLGIAMVAMTFSSAPVAAQAIVIVDVADGNNEGFNDPTPVVPIGRNSGRTIGEQRREAFQFAVNLWAAQLDSEVPIVVEANFDALECEPDSGTLGFAGPFDMFADFEGAPMAGIWYVSALANKLARRDLAQDAPDIFISINSSVDETPNCLGTTTWYYGYDGNAPEGTLDLVETVLHELAHGLGFLELTDLDFRYPDNTPDAYSSFIFDIELDRAWAQMSPLQRDISSKNDPNVVWNGEATTLSLPLFLQSAAGLIIDSPPLIADIYEAQAAEFGPPLTAEGLSGRVVLANDGVPPVTDGCQELNEVPPGSIVLIDRGDCFFTEKVSFAQSAGAAGVIIANNEASGLPAMGGIDPNIDIPSLGVSRITGESIRFALSQGVIVTLGLNPDDFAGSNEGRVRLFAPAQYAPGSSISHFTDLAMPDLLMEPFAGILQPFEVDLTRAALQDIGWTRRPAFDTTPPIDHVELDRYTYEAHIADLDIADELTLSVPELPFWLRETIDPDASTITIEGTPGENEAGEYRVILQAVDSFQNLATQDFTITVTGPNDDPVFLSTPVLEAQLGAQYTYDIVVEDVDPGDVPAISAFVPLPSWLDLDITGVGTARLSGTPVRGDLDDGEVSLRAVDGAGVAVLQNFTILVGDFEGPVITLTGDATLTLECGDDFVDPGASALDAFDSTVPVDAACTVNTSLVGIYTCTYTAIDLEGNQTEAIRQVEVVDNTPPIITLNGMEEINLLVNVDPFDDPGAIASDNCLDTIEVVVGGDTVDFTTEGEYLVTYTATDDGGNSTMASRRVIVSGDLPPVVTLNGEAAITLECGDPFDDPGATAVDDIDGSIEVTVTCDGDGASSGEFTCTYSATDSSARTTTVTRVVTVVDTQAPVITLNGQSSVTLRLESGTYTEQGAVAADACETGLVVVIAGETVNVNQAGEYVITYDAQDSQGNVAVRVTRTITVAGGIAGCAAGPSGGPMNAGDAFIVLFTVMTLAVFRRVRVSVIECGPELSLAPKS